MRVERLSNGLVRKIKEPAVVAGRMPLHLPAGHLSAVETVAGPNPRYFRTFVCISAKKRYIIETAAQNRPPPVSLHVSPGTFSNMQMLCPTRKNIRFNTLLCISLLIFAASLAFRLLKLALDPGLGRDSTLYLAWADSWFDTGNHLFYELDGPTRTPPLWPWAIKTVMAYGFNAEITGRAISQFLGSLIPVVGFFFAMKISRNIRIALLAAFVLVIQPDLVTLTAQPQRENFYLLFNALLLLAAADAIRNDSTLEWGVCGILLSLAVFCRHEAFEFALLGPLVLLLLFFFKKIELKQVFVRSAVFFAFFALSFLLLLSFVDFDYKFFFSPWKIVAWTNRALHALHVQ